MKRPAIAGLRLLAVSYALLLAAWVGANPPGMAPDEPAHYRRAVGLAQGEVVGSPAGYRRLPVTSASKLKWLNRTSRAVPVPGALRGCDAYRLPLHGRCPRDRSSRLQAELPPATEITYVGTYPPLGYVLPAAAIRVAQALGGGTASAVLAGRAVQAALCLALALVAARLLANAERPLLGTSAMVLATTPTVLFIAAELSPSGPEVAGALCVTAALLHLTRLPDRGPEVGRRPGAWAALAIGGWVLATSRSLGPGWLAALFVLVAALRGPRVVVAAFRRDRRPAACASAVVAAGVAFNLAWTLLVEPHPRVSARSVIGGVLPSLRQLPDVAAQAVGVFGWVDVPLPVPAQVALWTLLAGLVGLALRAGNRRQRRALAAAVVAQIAAVVFVSALVIRPTSPEFRMQGRYVLPLLVALPLLAAEVVACRRHASRPVLGSGRRWGPVSVLAAALALQGLSWFVNVRHYATDPRFHWQYPHGWRPPGGIALWTGVVILSMGAGALGLLRLARSTDGPSPDRPVNSAGRIPCPERSG